MDQPSPFSIHELLSLRLSLLRALADSLEQAQATLATTTPARLDQQTARQRELCRQLRGLAAGFRDGECARAQTGLADDLHVAARRVGDLNRKYAALLGRRRRTVDIFCRVLANSGTTYPAPRLLSRPDSKGTRPKG